MSRYASLLPALGLVAGLGLLSARPAAAQYSVTQLDAPNSTGTRLYGINDVGQVVGSYDTFSDPGDTVPATYGFVAGSGGFTPVMAPGVTDPTQVNFLEVSKINNSGTIVGDYDAPDGSSVNGFVGSPSVPVNDPNAAGFSVASGINNSGDTVGTYQDSLGASHGYVESGGVFTTIDAPSAGSTGASAINDAGTIVGTAAGSVTGPNTVSYIDNNGTFTFLGITGATDTVAEDINNEGVVAGYFDGYDNMGNFLTEGFLFSGGSLSVFSITGALATEIYGLNNEGDLVGAFTDSSGVEHGFLAAPVPEPSSWLPVLMVVLGVAGSALRARRRAA